MRNKALAIAVWLGITICALVLANADAENGIEVWSLSVAAAVFVGLAWGRWPAIFLPLVAIPLAIPFGYSDQHLGSDAPAVVWFAILAAVPLAAIIGASVLVRRAYDRWQEPPA
jgi:hypothetical protein